MNALLENARSVPGWMLLIASAVPAAVLWVTVYVRYTTSERRAEGFWRWLGRRGATVFVIGIVLQVGVGVFAAQRLQTAAKALSTSAQREEQALEGIGRLQPALDTAARQRAEALTEVEALRKQLDGLRRQEQLIHSITANAQALDAFVLELAASVEAALAQVLTVGAKAVAASLEEIRIKASSQLPAAVKGLAALGIALDVDDQIQQIERNFVSIINILKNSESDEVAQRDALAMHKTLERVAFITASRVRLQSDKYLEGELHDRD